MSKRSRARDGGYRWRMLPPARDPMRGAWLFDAALLRGDVHDLLPVLRGRLRARYDARSVFLTASGTDALALGLRVALHDRDDRRVALPAFGCYAILAAAVAADASVVFYDLDSGTLSPDEASLVRALERGAGAVVVAHLYGYPAEMERIRELAARAGARLVEDAAQGAGGTLGGVPLGGLGDLSVLSFGRGKGVTCGGGGALLVRDARLAPAFREEVRGILGPGGPARGSGWREVGFAAGQWIFGRPGLYRIPASIPSLELGETRYRPAGAPAPIADRAARLLAGSLGGQAGDEAAGRRRRAEDLADRIDDLPGIGIVRPLPGALPGALRLPFLMPATAAPGPGAPSLGVLRGYPRLLPELDPARGRSPDLDPARGRSPDNDPAAFPGARALRDRLHTAPTHDAVGERDLRAVARWVHARAGSSGPTSTRAANSSMTVSPKPTRAPVSDPGAPSGSPTLPDLSAGPEPAEAVASGVGSPGRRPRARRSGSEVVGVPPWDLLLAALAVFILTSVARVHLLFPLLAPLRPTLVAGVAALALFLLNHHPARRLATLRAPTTTLLLVFLGWMAMTVPWALREYRSFVFIVDDFGKTALLYALVVGAVRGIRDVERLAYVYFLGAAIYAAVIVSRYSVGGDSWRLGELVTYDANDFALFCVTAIPLGIYFLGDASRRLSFRLATLGALGVIGVGFVQAGSRGGFLALVVVAVYLVVRHRSVPFRWRVTGIGVLFLTLATVASARYWEQMSSLLDPSTDYNLTAETGRLAIWRRGMGYLWQSPLVGVGPSNFPVAEGVLSPLSVRQDYGIGVRWTAPHNSLVQVAVELGIPGLLVFVALVGSVFVVLRRLERVERPRSSTGARPARLRGGDAPGLAQALTGALVGFLVGACFLSLAYSAMLFTLAALAAGLWKTTRVGGVRGTRIPTPTAPAPADLAFLTGSVRGA